MGELSPSSRKGREPTGPLEELQGSFRSYVKRDFWELNRTFTTGPQRRAGVQRKGAAPSGLGGQSEAKSKLGLQDVAVKPGLDFPCALDERELLLDTCACIGHIKSGVSARIFRVRRMASDAEAQELARLCFWGAFIAAVQADLTDCLDEVGRRCAVVWQTVAARCEASDVLDLFAVTLAETVFQCFERTFPASKSSFDDPFAVFVYIKIWGDLFGVELAPVTVHALRGKFFPSFYAQTRGKGSGGISEQFVPAVTDDGVPGQPRADPLPPPKEDLARARSSPELGRSFATLPLRPGSTLHTTGKALAGCKLATPEFSTNTVSKSYEFRTGSGVCPGRGMTIRFIPFNAARYWRVKGEEVVEAAPPPAAAPDRGQDDRPDPTKQSELNKKLFAENHRALAALTPGGVAAGAKLAASQKRGQALPSAVRLSKQAELRRKQSFLPPHLRMPGYEGAPAAPAEKPA